MRTRVYTLLFLFTIPSFVNGQNFVFKVIANKGKTEYKTVEIKDWRPLGHGIGLYKNDIIKVGANSYLGLIHSSGRIAEVVEPGEMIISELESNLKQMKKGLPSKYIDFVYNTVASGESETLTTRGIGGIYVYLPAVSQVFGDEVLLVWDKPEGRETVDILISDIMADEVWTATVPGTSLLIDLTLPELKEQRNLIVQISSDRYKSNEYVISRISQERSEVIKQELESFVPDINGETPVGNALFGAFYEENNLPIDALGSYYKAVDGDLENDLFVRFLSRQGMLK